MNEVLIKNWNSVVSPTDTIFHLGDFAFGGSELWKGVLSQLNGKKILILGNHDMKNVRTGYLQMFDKVVQQMQIYIEGRTIYLNHYPFLCYGGSYRNDKDAVWQLYGHVHSGPFSTGLDTERLVHTFPTQYDVGVDNNNFTPVSWQQVKEIISKQIESSKK